MGSHGEHKHHHVWQLTKLAPVVVDGIRLSVYMCKCGTFLRRDQNVPRP